jgi:hypothetical protein
MSSSAALSPRSSYDENAVDVTDLLDPRQEETKRRLEAFLLIQRRILPRP